MAEPLVVVDGVWKKFRRGERSNSLLDVIPAAATRLVRWRRESAALADREFWALRDMSFEMGPGEAVGIIGPNGAGKSTLLKLLTRTLEPTRGYCHLRGRVGALIDGHSGFDPDLTGRENVFLQGGLMGMEAAAIARTFGEIVAFAGVTDFIETPLRHYSPGMSLRLGFAIATHLYPDVLLIDELLSAGDASFQERSMARLRLLVGEGVPLVFVSNNLPAIQELCTRAIVVDRGTVTFDGKPAAALAAYRCAPAAPPPRAQREPRHPIQIGGVELIGETGEDTAVFGTGGRMTVRIRYHVTAPVDRPHFAIDIYRADGVFCAGINTRMDGRAFGTLDGDGAVDLVLDNLALLPGAYVLSAGILDAHGAQTLDVHHRAYPFSVASSCRDLGLVRLRRSWRHWPNGATSTDAPFTPVVRQFRRSGVAANPKEEFGS